MKKPIALGALVVLGALIGSSSAWAHAHVSPPVVLANASQVFTVAVPNEKDDASTTAIEVTPPQGFSIDSFLPSPGWKLSVAKSGSGEDAVVEKVTWTGGSIPPGGATNFAFLARATGTGDYSFSVKQTYSDGSIVDWSGPESADTPAPVVQAVSSFGGGTSPVTWIALVLGIAGVVLGAAALLVRSGRSLA